MVYTVGCIRIYIRAITDITEFPDPHPDDADPPEWYIQQDVSEYISEQSLTSRNFRILIQMMQIRQTSTLYSKVGKKLLPQSFYAPLYVEWNMFFCAYEWSSFVLETRVPTFFFTFDLLSPVSCHFM